LEKLENERKKKGKVISRTVIQKQELEREKRKVKTDKNEEIPKNRK